MSTRTAPSVTSLVSFYDPQVHSPDSKGRTLDQILSWSDGQLEHSHDYIQILFPLPEGSAFNLSAPPIDQATFDAFRSRPELRSELLRAFERILRFYGLEYDRVTSRASDDKIQFALEFPRASGRWIMKNNHNHLRITRILRSLRVLGLEDAAQHFFDALKMVDERSPQMISMRSMKFWRRAAEQPLYIAPEDDRDTGMGRPFLYDFERERALEKEKKGEKSEGERDS